MNPMFPNMKFVVSSTVMYELIRTLVTFVFHCDLTVYGFNNMCIVHNCVWFTECLFPGENWVSSLPHDRQNSCEFSDCN